MIIILDGPDGTGKTTLAQQMCLQLGADYLHLTYRWKEKIFDYHVAAIRYAARRNKPIVIDRWWPSEAVYAKAFRGGSTWPMQGRTLDRVARKYGAIYVYCLSAGGPEEAIANHAKLKDTREEMYDDITDVAHLYHKLWYGESTHENKGQYIDYVIRSGGFKDRPDTLMYSIGDWGKSMELFIERVAELSDAWKNLQHKHILDSDSNVTGHVQKAKYAIVGTERWPVFKTNWAFHEHSGINLELSTKLNSLCLDEQAFIWANTFDHDGLPNMYLNSVLRDYPDIKLVTIGKDALKAFPDAYANLTKYDNPNPKEEFDYQRMMEVFKHAN
jgi:hypothetical protein